jgi:hypothetical protein
MRAARRFKLETLFGSGPVGSPFVYALDAPNDDRRTKLRLGRMRWKDKGVEPGCPFRDIARAPAENVTGIDRSIAGTSRCPHRGAGRRSPQRRSRHHVATDRAVCAAAQRPDRLVRRHEPANGPNASFGAAYKRFLCARGALTLIYHNIIRKDLMRRVLHPAIYAAYSGPNPDFIDRNNSSQRFPVCEEPRTAGKFRSNSRTARSASATPWCGLNITSMICRPTTSTTRSKRPRRTIPSTCRSIRPGSCAGRASSRSTGSRPNFSRRIGPYLSDGLGNDQIFPAIDETERVGLLYRDLFGAAMAGMWSVDALIAEIAVRRPHFIGMSRLLADRAYRVSQLREWLASAPGLWRLTAEDIETLSNDPPLPFFILFEAMQQPRRRACALGRSDRSSCRK